MSEMIVQLNEEVIKEQLKRACERKHQRNSERSAGIRGREAGADRTV